MVDDVCLRCKVSMWALVCATVVYAAESEHPVLGQVSSHATVPQGETAHIPGFVWSDFFYFPNGKSTTTGESIKWMFFFLILGGPRISKSKYCWRIPYGIVWLGNSWDISAHFDTCFDAHMDNQHVLARTRRTSWTKLPGVCNSLLVKITMFYVYFSNTFYGNSSN